MTGYYDLCALISELRGAIGDRLQDEVFLSNPKNWLPRVWQKLSVLREEKAIKYCDELNAFYQAKIIRIILKNIPSEEAEKYLKMCRS